MTRAPDIPPIVKTIRLSCTPAEAFRAFTDDFGRWWPYATHSLGGADQVARVEMEPPPNGCLYEVWHDGSRHAWGSILSWEPPHALAFSWHVGRDPSAASEVHLAIAAEGDGCRVELTHRGWENLGAGATAIRERYDSGWVEVFERRFGDHARRGATMS